MLRRNVTKLASFIPQQQAVIKNIAPAVSATLKVQKTRLYSTETPASTQSSSSQKESSHSYVKGTESDLQISKHTIGYFLSSIARASPFSNAIRSTHQSTGMSYSSLKKNVEALACGLVELGLRPNDRVALVEGNRLEQIVTVLACAKVGATCVTYNNLKNAKDYTRFLELFKPSILITAQKLGKTNYANTLFELFPEFKKRQITGENTIPFTSRKFPFLKQILFTNFIKEGARSFDKLREILVYGPFGYYENPLRRIAMELNPEIPAMIMVEGSDINSANAYAFSHANVLAAGKIVGQAIGVSQTDRVIVPNNVDNSFGGIIGQFTALVNGAALVYPSEEWDAGTVIKQIEKEQATILFAKASELEEMLKHKSFSEYKKGALKTIVVDDAATEEQVEKYKSRFQVDNVRRVSVQNESTGLLLIDGKPVASTEMKVTRKDGKIVHQDTYGTLKVRGPLVPVGRWTDVGLQNLEKDEEGWVITNKVAKVDAAGNLSLQ